MTRTNPIVFGSIVDPVGSGIVESISQPGGNVTGFTNYEYSIGPKWLELLKEIAPGVKRVGILRDPTNVAEIGMLGAIQTAGPQFGVNTNPSIPAPLPRSSMRSVSSRAAAMAA